MAKSFSLNMSEDTGIRAEKRLVASHRSGFVKGTTIQGLVVLFGLIALLPLKAIFRLEGEVGQLYRKPLIRERHCIKAKSRDTAHHWRIPVDIAHWHRGVEDADLDQIWQFQIVAGNSLVAGRAA